MWPVSIKPNQMNSYWYKWHFILAAEIERSGVFKPEQVRQAYADVNPEVAELLREDADD